MGSRPRTSGAQDVVWGPRGLTTWGSWHPGWVSPDRAFLGGQARDLAVTCCPSLCAWVTPDAENVGRRGEGLGRGGA